MIQLDRSHDVAARSWEPSANQADTDFPLQNLPLGIFSRKGEAARAGVALGDFVVDLAVLREAGLVSGEALAAAEAAAGPTLNPLLAQGRGRARALRLALFDLLAAGSAEGDRAKALRERLLVPMAEAEMVLPVAIGGFTDFLCSADHTLRMGRNQLPPAFIHLPVAYNSRASSVRVSGEEVRRPNGIWREIEGEAAVFGPEPWLDFELELGAFVAGENALGTPLAIETAAERLFGYCLLNDWSARRIQLMESMLGPFLGKSLSTTISPWIVTADALAPFAVAARTRPDAERPLPHLLSAEDQEHGGLDITMEALISTATMRDRGDPPHRLVRADYRRIYWTFAQMLTHHASNGCNLRPGDLFGSGTVSGPTDDSRACLAEINQWGKATFTLADGEQRSWLEDGDEVIFRARASREGFASIGFGECRGRIAPAPPWPAGR